MAAKKIRVHNKGKRDYTLPPAKKGGKNRLLPAGRAIEIEEKLALKLIENYPSDLVEFDSLVSGEKKNLSKENSRLESENEDLIGENDQFRKENQGIIEKNEDLNDKILKLEKEKEDLNDKNQVLEDKVSALEKDLEASTQQVDNTKAPAETDKSKKE